ncbi:MAG: hypothetical protein HZB56_16040 [Deltaproteobacteria bacterium]|nr:hypothetical protein [Deltaproteobacteria bacterium]
MTGLWLAVLLAAPAAACDEAAALAALPAEQFPAVRLTAEAPRLAAEAARAGPAAGLEALAAELTAAAPGEQEARAARFAAALAWHCRLAGSPPAARALSPADRAALDRLLAEPRFTRSRALPARLLAWLEQLWDRLAELLGTEEAEQVASRGRTAFFLAAALLAGAVVLAALRRRRVRRRRSAALAAPAVPAAAPAPDGPDAEAALAAGRGEEAVRAALLSSLAALEQAERLPAGRALTNREAALRLAGSEAAAPFELVAAAFDRAVYGRVAPGPAEAAACVAAARRLRAALAEGER